jgi:Putative DNA-binding domain
VRPGNYNDVLYRAALVKNDGAWQSAVLFICPRQKGDICDEAYRADYGDFLIVRGSFPLDEAGLFLEGVVEKSTMSLPGTPSVEMNVYLDANTIRRHGSQDRRFPVRYAAYEYWFQVYNGGQRPNVPNGFVCSPGLPVYPHAYTAIEHQLGIRVINQGTYEVAALAPDYRARVKRVQLSGHGGTVEIETLESSGNDILGKVYYEDAHGRITHHDLTFTKGSGSFVSSAYPKQMVLLLVSLRGGDVIDEWFYSSGLQGYNSFGTPSNVGAEIEANEENLESLIRGGESETLEFKEKVPEWLTLSKTVSAFANSGGGRLLIGINDGGEVVGCEVDKLADKLTNLIHAHCEPTPSFTTASLKIRYTNVIVVTILNGGDKPYVVTDHGVYIRVGATTRRANRYEMDRLYGGK